MRTLSRLVFGAALICASVAQAKVIAFTAPVPEDTAAPTGVFSEAAPIPPGPVADLPAPAPSMPEPSTVIIVGLAIAAVALAKRL
jgi:hypothetical protein